MPNLVLQTPSLQHLAAVKTAAAYWNHPGILKPVFELIAEYPPLEDEQFEVKWGEIEGKVKAKVLTLELTAPCKQRVLNFIVPLGGEIFDWCHYMYKLNENDEFKLFNWEFPKQFCWTMLGAVDYAKTAQLLVKDERLSIERRYALACLNCLEEEARDLIRFLSEDRKQEYMDREIDLATGGRRARDDFLITYFTCCLSGNYEDEFNVCFQELLPPGTSIRSVQHYLFDWSLHDFNRAKSEYFLNKLNQEEREISLGKIASNCATFLPNSTVLFYFPLMNEEQQRRIFRECISDVLVHLSNWPWQPLFMEAAMRGWRYMVTLYDYEKVLSTVTLKIRNGYEDYNYSQLFRECWSLTPADVKLLLLDNVRFLVRLLKTKREEFIKLILNKAPAHQLLALSNNFDENCQMLLDEGVISDAALRKCKERAALKSAKKERDVEKRLRSEHLNQFVDIVIEERIKRRRL